MHKIDAPNHINNEFTDGDAASGILATVLWAKFMNTIQRELVNLVQAAGITLDDGDDAQVLEAIVDLIAVHNLASGSHLSETVVTAGGGFTGTNNVRLVKMGKIVVMQCDSIGHSSAFGVASATGAIPAAYRPASEIDVTYFAGGVYRKTVTVFAYDDASNLGRFGVGYKAAGTSNDNIGDTQTGPIVVTWATP